MTGKVLTQYKGYVENYTQEFILSGIGNGLYVINIQGNDYQFSEKLLSNGISNGTPSIVKISNNIQADVEKRSIIDSKGVQGNVNMTYTAGQRLKYTAVSGNNKTVLTDIPTANKTVTFTFTECKDGDNNYYPVVQINTQLWMAENLKTTKFNDGSSIPLVTDATTWINLSTPGYCWYKNDEATYKATYGALYNWYAISTTTNGNKNVCPASWHVPTDAEWTTLENYLIAGCYNYDGTTTGNKYAKSLASTNLWISSTGSGTVGNTDYPFYRNSTGFTSFPGGYRYTLGAFDQLGYFAYFWSATEYSSIYGWNRGIYTNGTNVGRSSEFGSKKYGFSVRCVKD